MGEPSFGRLRRIIRRSFSSRNPAAALIGSRVHIAGGLRRSQAPFPGRLTPGLAGWPVLAQLCDGGMVSYLTIGESDRNMGAPAVLDFWEVPKPWAPRCCFRHLHAGTYVIDPWHVKNTAKILFNGLKVHTPLKEKHTGIQLNQTK